MGRFQLRQNVGEHFMGEESASPTNPKKGRSGNLNMKWYRPLERHVDQWK